MLSRIPLISKKDLEKFFVYTDSKLSVYENLKDAPMMLELAIWKSKITEQNDMNNDSTLTDDTKMQCRIASFSMVAIIVPNVLSFLTDGDDGIHLIGSDGDSDSDDRYTGDDSDEDVIDDDDVSEESS